MGLLARAEEYLQWEAQQMIAAEQRMAKEQMALETATKQRRAKIKKMANTTIATAKTAKTKLTHLVVDFKTKAQTVIKKAYQPQFRRYAAMILAVGLSLQNAEPRVLNTSLEMQRFNNLSLNQNVTATVQPQQTEQNFEAFVDIFTKDIKKTKFNEQDRNDLARLLYGEAGPSFADMAEIMHTISNRMASPLFKGTLHDIITAKNQYVGFNANHPVDPKIREFVDWYLAEWEANGCQAIPDCNRYYFVTGIAGVCNKFEISAEGSQGSWVPAAHKNYDKPGHYCHTAMEQAKQFNRWYEMKHHLPTRESVRGL